MISSLGFGVEMPVSNGTDRVKLNTRRLVQICGMLGSDFPGERSNAAEMATAILKEAGLTWESLLLPILDEEAKPADQPKVKTARRGKLLAFSVIFACMGRVDYCTSTWDSDFIVKLHGLCQRFGVNTSLTEKQWNQLVRIAAELNVLGDE